MVVILSVWLSACTWDDFGLNALNQIDERAKDNVEELSPEFNHQHRRSHISVTTEKNAALERKIKHLSLVKNIALKDALKAVLPQAYIIADDTQVNLNTPINVDVDNISYKEYFEILSSQTGYRIDLKNTNKISVSSADYKRWNVAALVSLPKATSDVGGNAKAGSAGGSSSLSFNKSDDTWDSLLEGLKEILGKSGVVVDNRRLGEIYALGDPQKLIAADKWMQRMIASSQRQILLDVAVLEVSASDGAANGIDWQAIYNQGGTNNATISRDAAQELSGGGAWSIVGSYVKSKFNLSATVNFLRKRGKVNVQHHPSLTVTNGSTAYLGAAEQFSYVNEIKKEKETSDAGTETDSTTITHTAIDVGLNIAMTARLLENNEILIEVVPVISYLQGFDTLYSDGNNILKTPKITLQELATQVIAKSGQPIHLGGLIIKKIEESASNVPGALGRVFNLLFQSGKKEFAEKEILLIITPTEI